MDEKYYFRVYEKYLSRSNEQQKVIDWVHEHAGELELQNVQTVLSIGGGAGDLDLYVLSCFPSLTKFVVVEPSALMVDAFKRRLQRLQQEHKESGGMLKDRELESVFKFECCKFEEITTDRLAELVSPPRGRPLFDFAIMSHCLYYMDPEAAVLRTGLMARKLVIIHDDHNDRFITGDSTDVVGLLKELAARPRPQSTDTNPGGSETTLADSVYVNRVDAWLLPFTVDVKDIDDDSIDFLLFKLADPEEREKLRERLKREFPDGLLTGSNNVVVVTFDGQ